MACLLLNYAHCLVAGRNHPAQAQPSWCPKKQKIAAMASVADNVTVQLWTALKQQEMWPSACPRRIFPPRAGHFRHHHLHPLSLCRLRLLGLDTILVFSSDNGGDSGDSSNYPLRGRKRTFFVSQYLGSQ